MPLPDKWDDPLCIIATAPARRGETVRASAEKGNPVKVKIARHVCDIWPGDDLPLDLKALMKEVVTFIRMANGPSKRLPVQPIPDWRPMA